MHRRRRLRLRRRIVGNKLSPFAGFLHDERRSSGRLLRFERSGVLSPSSSRSSTAMTADPFNLRKESSVSSRFVSSTELSEAQKRREADLKAAYARIGQEAPASASLKEEEYDPRSLYERLQANKDAKQENFEETWKLSNQFRGIDEGESEFLAEVAKDKAEAERRKREQERKELEEFRR